MSGDIDFGEMKEIIDEFLVESHDLLGALDTNLIKLESAPDDLALLNDIFRAAHTIKGTSSFLGFDNVTTLTHKMEDVLNRLRKGEMPVTPAIMDVLLQSLDTLKQLIGNLANNAPGDVDLSVILARLNEAGHAGTAAAAPKAPELQGRSRNDTARGASSSPKDTLAEQTIRVKVDRLDSLMNLMGELVLGRNSLLQVVGRITSEYECSPFAEQLNQSTAILNYITTELQVAVMKMRMQPISRVFSKFPRLVRDLARDAGKQVELIVEGEETELDKSVIEIINDPLVHILRNACDHGIEMPEDRLKKGKLAKGTILLTASQEGSSIVIRIGDDGRGLDLDAIRTKAAERGLAARSELEKMPDREVFRFVFEPGFSTAKTVSDVSGRGVGMDVVRNNIEKLNGLIELESQPDRGTTLTIKLPLTLATLHGLPIECDGDIYILPLSSVIETVKTSQADVCYINRRPVLRLRNEVIPVIALRQALGVSSGHLVIAEKPYIVVVGLAERKLGINIDRFLEKEEVVIKSLGSYLGPTEGIAGATILGDGRVRLIIDLLGLFGLARKAM